MNFLQQFYICYVALDLPKFAEVTLSKTFLIQQKDVNVKDYTFKDINNERKT